MKKIIFLGAFICSLIQVTINGSPSSHFSQAQKLFYEKKIDSAIEAIERAINIEPENVQALVLYGELLMNVKKEQEAYNVLLNAAKFDPKDHNLRIKLANNLLWIGNNRYSRQEIESALEVYKSIVLLFPNNFTILHNIATALSELNQPHEAIEIYKQALELKPNEIGTNFGLGTAYLSVGDYKLGWQGYEWRWKKQNQTLGDLPYKIWDGSNLNGKTILLRTEGALGDSIQFVRYAKIIKSMGATVIVQTHKPLKVLFEKCPHIDSVITNYDQLPAVDFQISLMSLPFLCNTTVETVPSEIPYLHVDYKLVNFWHSYLQNTNYSFNIGICWQADLHNDAQRPADARRSIPINCFAPLATISRVKLFSLQRGATGPISFPLHTFNDDFDVKNGRFMDTAALIKNLDLVITVDTSIAHLAGALGTPTWTLLPFKSDWRWIVDRNDTPWYSNMILFRKEKTQTWQQLIETVVEQIKQIAK